MKKILNTPSAAMALGPYNVAIEVSNLVFISGQVPIDRVSGQIVGNDARSQTKQVMMNIKSILADIKLEMDHIVKCTIFLKSMDDFTEVNQIYGSFFSHQQYPTRETVEVSRLPKDVLVEISAIVSK